MRWIQEDSSDSRQTGRLLILLVLAFTLLTALLSVSLHYYFSRQLALNSAAERYRLTATETRNYLAEIDAKAFDTVRLLARFPGLVVSDESHAAWAAPDALALFAEVMRTSPLIYALYVGFDNGDLFELVNLNCSEAVRRQLNATAADRWVIIRVEGEGAERRRTFDYLSADFVVNFSRSEPSDYDVRQRLWYTSAGGDDVHKTPAYLFQHLQAPGQSFVMKLPGSGHVLALDITFSTMSAHLRGQSLSAEGELFLFSEDGALLASNQNQEESQALPPVERLALTDEQRRYLRSLGSIRASNENDWSPIDFAVGGQPQGYSVDILRLIAQMTGMSLEFVNGYRWPELVSQFEQGELELLQPVMNTNRSAGGLTRSLVHLPYALLTRSDAPEPESLAALAGKVLAIPEGWSVVNDLREYYPGIELKIVPTTRDALLAVSKGDAYATLDLALILEQGLRQYYLSGLRLTHDLADMQSLPQDLFIRVRPGLEPLRDILDQALEAIPAQAYEFLENKWFRQSLVSQRKQMAVVPYQHLLQLPQLPLQQNLVTRVDVDGEPWFSFASVFTREQNPNEYFALMIPASQVYARALHDVWVSVLIIAIVLLVLIPPVLIYVVVRPLHRLRQHP